MEVRNKQLGRSYALKDRFEAGIVLMGPEVKSCKKGNVNFKGAYCSFEDNNPRRLLLKNFYIAPYVPAKREQQKYDPKQPRVLLLKRKELNMLWGKSNEQGITLVPVKMYTKNRLVKLEIAIAHGLKKQDKREKIKRREFERRKQRLVRG